MKRNVFKNLKKKYKNIIKLKIGTYKKVEKRGNVFCVYVDTGSCKNRVFTCKKVIFCMGFIDNISEKLKENESFKFKEHLSSPIGVISNTEKFPLSPSLSYKFSHFKTKRYEIFDKKQKRSIGFLHLSSIKSEFLTKLRELLICMQSFKLPSFKLTYDIIILSYQIVPTIINLIFNDGDISNKK